MRGKLQRVIRLVLDASVLAAAFFIAYELRFDFDIPTAQQSGLGTRLVLVVLIQLVALVLAGAHQFVWRYVGLAELPAFLIAAVYWTVPLLAGRFLFSGPLTQLSVPLSVILFDGVLAVVGLLGLRVVRRSIYEGREKRGKSLRAHVSGCARVILAGAGRAGVLSVREMRGRGDLKIDAVGFVDDDPLKRGSVIQGLKVLGTTRELPRLVRQLDVDQVIITMADVDPDVVRRIAEICERIPVKVRSIPGYYDILQGNVSFSRISDVDVNELLNRSAVRLETQALGRFLAHQRVLITGAGGSIGAELTRQVAQYDPECLLLVERAEFALFEIHRQLQELWPGVPVVPKVADAGDPVRMRSLMEEYRPDIVIHAAAHKHVPMMEVNVKEAVRNNVLATLSLGELAGEFEVKHFVLVSTDKAVRPRSIMGATKRMAELIIQNLDKRFTTSYVAVRFGNVLGSTGSVIPIFQEQIRKGGPVTVTHHDMTRYFMSVTEAAQLVLSAAAIGSGGEIFVLDMGEPVRIIDLAEKLIRLSGFEPHREIPIVYTKPRSGEKLVEELSHAEEGLDGTRHPRIFIGHIPSYSAERIETGVRALDHLVRHGSGADIRAFFNDFFLDANIEVAEAGAASREPAATRSR